MKKLIAAGMALALLAALSTATASEAGTITDPLITRSYAEGTYADSVIKAGADVIESRLETFRRLVGADPYAGMDITRTQGWELLASQVGGSVTLVMGSSFILTEGSGTVEITSGHVIDIATGEDVASGTTLRKLARYFCTEDTIALFKSTDGIAFMVEGGYIPDSGTSRQYQDYSDVLGLEWYTDPARYVKTTGLYHDSAEAAFRPQETITRAELVYALWKACDSPISWYFPTFTDLEEDWYVPAVCWAAEYGITAGLNETTFSPMGGVNREQMAAMLYRCAQVLGADVSPRADLTVYSDWEMINDWGSDPISWATALGYISGMNDGTVNPWGIATRAQAASVIMRYVTLHLPAPDPEAPEDDPSTVKNDSDTPVDDPNAPPENTDAPDDGSDVPQDGTDTSGDGSDTAETGSDTAENDADTSQDDTGDGSGAPPWPDDAVG